MQCCHIKVRNSERPRQKKSLTEFQVQELAKRSKTATSSAALCMTVLIHKVTFKNGPIITKTSDFHEHRKRNEQRGKRAMFTRCKQKD